MAKAKEMQQGDRVVLNTENGKMHGTVIDNLSSMYFIELDDNTELYIFKKDGSLKRE
jgi:preprotein translocase subunit YajC